MNRRYPKRKLKQSNLIEAFKKQRTISTDPTDPGAAGTSSSTSSRGGVIDLSDESGMSEPTSQKKELEAQAQRSPTSSINEDARNKPLGATTQKIKANNTSPEVEEESEPRAKKPAAEAGDESSKPQEEQQQDEEQQQVAAAEAAGNGEAQDSQTSNISATFDNPDSPDLFEDAREDELLEDLPSQSLQETPPEKEDGPSVGIPKNKLKTNPECAAHLSELRNTPSVTVLFKTLPSFGKGVPSPKSERYIDRWDYDHVRMPCSTENLYPIEKKGKKDLGKRWELIQTALLGNIQNSYDLEEAILAYNTRYSRRWDFSALHRFFIEELNEEESNVFFKQTLPKVVELALQLPKICPEPVPLLRNQSLKTIHITQKQAACLLANAFFCTFPRRNTKQKDSEYSNFPDINFNALFMGGGQGGYRRKLEKMKCVMHYFSRVTTEMPKGTLSFRRQLLKDFPQWERSVSELGNLHITAKGSIEDDGIGMLQVDFANKYIGGGVLGRGCVQEEIRFLICPEMIVSRLFTEVLDKNECLIMTGCERYSNYTGYADSFEWNGNHNDPTPMDSWGRKYTEVVGIDALVFRSYSDQFDEYHVTRELNKAYCGFLSPGLAPGNLSAVATGNWGCGAFGGDLRLKALIQIMAASEAKRDVCYFTFGDYGLRDEVHKIHTFIKGKSLTTSDLWALISQYSNVQKVPKYKKKNLYQYIYGVYNDCYDAETDEDATDKDSQGSDISREMQFQQQQGDSSPDYAACTP